MLFKLRIKTMSSSVCEITNNKATDSPYQNPNILIQARNGKINRPRNSKISRPRNINRKAQWVHDSRRRGPSQMHPRSDCNIYVYK